MNTMTPPQPTIPAKVTLPHHREAYYGGKWHAPKDGRYVDSINPGTGESLGKVAECGAADMDAAVASAKAAFREWRRVPTLERGRILKRVAQILREQAGELAMIDAADCGNPVKEMLADAPDCGRADRVLRRPRDRSKRCFNPHGARGCELLRT